MSEDGSDVSPKRKKKQRPHIMSESESEGDDDVQLSYSGQNRRYLCVMSDDESSDSSVGASRRTHSLPQLPETSEDSGGSHDEGEPVQSDSSDGNSDKCPICLARLAGQNVGVPESCEHVFCAECITEWARNVNTCPVDRMTFASIVVREGAGGRIVQTRSVNEAKSAPFEEMFEEEVTCCQVCNSGADEATMLLCDSCDEGFHMRCLSPPLDEIPEGDWYCPNCAPSQANIALSNALVARVERHLGSLAAAAAGGVRRRTARRSRARRTRTVVTEYEVQDGGKFPSRRHTIKRRIKKRKAKRRSARTAARRAAVRATVRERLVALAGARSQPVSSTSTAISAPTLSLFGSRDQLDYFSEEEGDDGSGPMFAVARRPSASVLSAYRQARRKMISIPSPPRSTAVPDLLSDIMESQSRLHSKKSLISVTVDGTVNIKFQTTEKIPKSTEALLRKDNTVDLSKSENSTRKAPSYPGHSRGNDWGGGHRGGYQGRDYRGNQNGSYSGGYQSNQGGYSQGNQGFDQGTSGYNQGGSGFNQGGPGFNQNFLDAPVSYHGRRPNEDDLYGVRNRIGRPSLGNAPYSRSFSDQPRSSLRGERLAFPIITGVSERRRTFGGMDQSLHALDMRMAQEPPHMELVDNGPPPDMYGDIPPREPTPPRNYEPLPEPPIFRFPIPLDKDEEDAGLVIDTEKYDPTEPTNDDSDEEKGNNQRPIEIPVDPPIPTPLAYDEIPPRPLDASPLRIQSTILDKAVKQVINEHRSRFGSSPAQRATDYKSDDDSEGDCPNFSIYSATSVNIANNPQTIIQVQSTINPTESEYLEKEEDLVQEDDDIPMPEETPKAEEHKDEVAEKEKMQNERISKKCPITPSVRNPIKIKLTSTSLIKRNVNLEEEESETKVDSSEKLDTNKVSEDSDDIQSDSEIKVDVVDNVATVEGSNIESHEKYTEQEILSQESNENMQSNDELDREQMGNICTESTTIKDSDPKLDATPEKIVEALEKMTESISESEDERSYTPCLDEKGSKDNSFENDKDNAGLEGLETEMISEEEGNDMFSDTDDKRKESDEDASPKSMLKEELSGEEGEAADNKDQDVKSSDNDDKSDKSGKKKRRNKDKGKVKSKKSGPIFKKLSKSGKERNYRDKDDKKSSGKERKKDEGKDRKDKSRGKKREKRKDLERYDVRSVVTEKKRRVKDAFGRDISPRSQSGPPSLSTPARMRSRSKDRYTPSIGKRRSISRGGKSVSPRRPMSPRRSVSPRNRILMSPARRRSISPRFRRSISPRNRRSVSPRNRRSITPRNRRSISPRIHRRSVSPRIQRRSISPRMRRPISPRVRRSISPRVRSSISPRHRRSLSMRRSISPRGRRHSGSPKGRKKRRSLSPRKNRSISPGRRRSLSRGRKRGRSRSPKRKSKSPRKKSKKSLSRNRSRSPKAKKSKTTKKSRRSPKRKSPKNKRRISRSPSPELMLSPVMMRERSPVWRNDNEIYREWSESVHSIPSRMLSPSWTPPREPSPEPHNLRVFLTNRDANRRREKRKRRDERCAPDMGPSKEVFTSGNNILVSVSFNKDELAQNADGEKRRKRKGDGKKDKKIKRKRGDKRKDTENKKPVAIIDLDKSPFRELTPSPKNVIVLSDSDQGGKDERPPPHRPELRETAPVQPEPTIPPTHREMFNVGPKTPPEPVVKFSIASKPGTQLRMVNPLHEEEDTTEHVKEGEKEDASKDTHKGPNTPPEPPNTPPSSPDAYDPFEPTKSGSNTPEPQPNQENSAPSEKTAMTLETAQKTNMSADEVLDQRPITPIEKVMALLQSTRNVSPTNVQDEPLERPNEADVANASGEKVSATPDVAPLTSTASVYPRISPRSANQTMNQRIVLPSPNKSSPLKTQPAKLFLAKPSPIKSTPIKPMPAKTLLKLPLPSIKPLPGKPIDLSDSPYSPGSDDFGDLFEPPTNEGKSYKNSGDIFDSLFGSKPKKSKNSATKVPVKQIKKGKKGKTQVGVKIDEDSLKILDDLPSSAVEMQVKSKFLKKLNRQERVVEEVKLVLKPHYNKKHVTKEQYKDIMRRAVPKICHNKTGEINPSKIQSLVEAYVKKARARNKSHTL